MILPVSHDRGTVRAVPWVTITIAVLMVGTFLWSRGRWEVVDRSDELRRQAVVYWLDHPELEPAPELLPSRAVEALRKGLSATPDPATRLAQRRLDTLTSDWKASTEGNVLYDNAVIPAELGPRGLLLYAFFHADWAHLLGNLLMLYLTAPFVEDRWGRWRFAAFYLAASLASALLFATQYPDLHAPLLGASGAINGVVAAFLVEFFRSRLSFVIAPLFPFPPYLPFSLPTLVVVPAIFGLDLLMSFVGDRVLPGLGLGVAYWAHVGGFVFGLVVALAAKAVAPHAAAGGRTLDQALRDSERARQLVRHGRDDDAQVLLRRVLEQPPADVELLRHIWETACLAGAGPQLARAVESGLRKCVTRGAPGDVASLWREMASDVPAHRFHPAFELRIGEELIRRGDVQGATLAFQRLGEGADGNLTPELATRCGRLSERPGLSDELRRELERLGEKAGELGPLGEPRASVAGRPELGWRAPHASGAKAE